MSTGTDIPQTPEKGRKSQPTSGPAEIPESENLVDDPTDQVIDLNEWLARDESTRTGYATLSDGSRIKIAALTEKENNWLQELSRKPDPQNPKAKGKLNANLLRQRIIAYSLSKAAGVAGTPHEIQPHALNDKLSGELTRIQRQIQELSGMETERPDPNDFFD